MYFYNYPNALRWNVLIDNQYGYLQHPKLFKKSI